ncbi:MAG: MerC domain-containing protein [Ferruginibacter sp.]
MHTKINWDFMGMATSLACAVHCVLLPVFVSSLPVFGINIIHNSLFEWGMIALAFVVGFYSLLHGYIKHHHSLSPVYIFLVGFLFLVLKQFFHPIENLFLVFAVPFIIAAHLQNYRLSQRQKCSSAHHRH